jgi:hypothetical protein
MKRILLLFITLAICPLWLFSQAPQAFKYQTVVRNTEGDILANKSISLQMSILKGSVSGDVVYRERHYKTSNSFGLINLEIGNGEKISGDFATIPWGEDIFFLQIEMDISGGNDFQFFGTQQLLSVPYALHAGSADNAIEYEAGDGIEVNDNIITNTSPDQEVTVQAGEGIEVSGEYPDFTVTNTFSTIVPDPSLPIPIIHSGGIIYVHPTDNSTDVYWGSTDVETNAISLSNGELNTQMIVDNLGPGNYAAYVCDTLTAFGYDDWYLPSIMELNSIYLQSYLFYNDTFYWSDYWSSTEASIRDAFIIHMCEGYHRNKFKLYDQNSKVCPKCRCIRKD